MYYLLVILISLSTALLAERPLDTQPPPLLLAKPYQSSIEVRDYWISEKLDGVRAYWNGQQLLSRSGRRINAPDWYIAGFPATALDGELWISRQSFDEVSSIVRKSQAERSEWQRVRYMIFDSPQLEGEFEQRLQGLKQLIKASSSPYLKLIPQFKVDSESELMAILNQRVQQGAEGLMLHKANSLYRSGRHDDLLKLKPYQDAEAVVVKHLQGKGQFKGMMGALLVENESGIQFKIGTGFSHAERRHPPQIGSTITYRYHGLTRHGLPRFASFVRIRHQQ